MLRVLGRRQYETFADRLSVENWPPGGCTFQTLYTVQTLSSGITYKCKSVQSLPKFCMKYTENQTVSSYNSPLLLARYRSSYRPVVVAIRRACLLFNLDLHGDRLGLEFVQAPQVVLLSVADVMHD